MDGKSKWTLTLHNYNIEQGTKISLMALCVFYFIDGTRRKEPKLGSSILFLK